MAMRVLGGRCRGRRLKAPGGLALRPTAGRVRASLFEILAPRLPGAVFADLCAGTGGVGIEALSRGADRTVFVERHRPTVRLLRTNLQRAGLADRAEIYAMEVDQFLRAAGRQGHRFDLLFLDPPYAAPELETILTRLAATPCLSEDGLLIVEHASRRSLPDRVGRLVRARHRRYGDTSLSFYRDA